MKHIVWIAALWVAFAGGCGGQEQRDDFQTSGSRAADQRAEQIVARDQQMRGDDADAAEQGPLPLYQRLGGEAGVAAIVDDWIDRVLADPRVNWERRGVTRGGVLGLGGESVQWEANAANVARLKNHVAQFIAVATGGPTQYDGRGIKEVHTGMGVTNAQFDASVGCLKVTMDALGVQTDAQKELIAVVESTRPQVAEER